jgi:hypothetical protein
MTATHEPVGSMRRPTLTLRPSAMGPDDHTRLQSRRARIMPAARITFKAHSAATRVSPFEAAARRP